MKPFKFALLAIGSAALAVAHAGAARPSYGGALRVQDTGIITTADPAAQPADDAERSAREHVLPLVFETVIAIDPSSGLQPLLATSWDADAQSTRWRVHLRRNVLLHDGSALEPWHVASALRRANPEWTVTSDGDSVVIDAGRSRPDLPWELTDARYAVAVRSRDGAWIGSGPFRIHRLDPRHVSLRAHEQYWNSRPFLDAIEVDMGQAPGQQAANLEIGRADLVGIRQTDVHRLSQLGFRTSATRPLDLVAIVFEPHRAQAADERLRHALALAIDRPVLSNALLQGYAAPAIALLPRWVSGYELPGPRRGSVAPAIASLPLPQRRLILRIAPGDPLEQAIADRIVVDAHQAGISISVQAPTGLAPRPDARLVRVRVVATSPDRALIGLLGELGPRVVSRATIEEAPRPGAPTEAVYRFERALLDSDVIIPVVHLSDVYGVSDRVESVTGRIVQPAGAWDLANVWLTGERVDSR